MVLKALTTAGAAIALLAASSAFAADTAPKQVSAKDALKIAQISRARTHMVNGKANKDGTSTALLILAVGAGGVGIAAAAGAFNSSN